MTFDVILYKKLLGGTPLFAEIIFKGPCVAVLRQVYGYRCNTYRCWSSEMCGKIRLPKFWSKLTPDAKSNVTKAKLFYQTNY